MQPITDRTRITEITAVLLTAAGRFIFMDWLNWRLAFILIVIVCWTAYVAYRSRRTPGIIKHWGFRADNFKRTFRIILPYAVAALVACIGIGIYQHTIHTSWHILPLLLLYPAWGIIQQFLVIALMAGNLQDMRSSKLSKPVCVFIAALLFGLIHYPYKWLMLGTFVLALFYGAVYLKERNLYVLGIFHGWLAAIFFYTVVNRDPFVETFGGLLHLSK